MSTNKKKEISNYISTYIIIYKSNKGEKLINQLSQYIRQFSKIKMKRKRNIHRNLNQKDVVEIYNK